MKKRIYEQALLDTYNEIVENGYNISLILYIYMDVVNQIEVLETDVKDCHEKCQRVNCNAIYDDHLN